MIHSFKNPLATAMIAFLATTAARANEPKIIEPTASGNLGTSSSDGNLSAQIHSGFQYQELGSKKIFELNAGLGVGMGGPGLWIPGSLGLEMKNIDLGKNSKLSLDGKIFEVNNTEVPKKKLKHLFNPTLKYQAMDSSLMSLDVHAGMRLTEFDGIKSFGLNGGLSLELMKQLRIYVNAESARNISSIKVGTQMPIGENQSADVSAKWVTASINEMKENYNRFNLEAKVPLSLITGVK